MQFRHRERVQLQLYSFSTWRMMAVGGQRHATAALSPVRRPGTHCTGGWVGPRAYLDAYKEEKNFLPSLGFRTPNRPSRTYLPY